MKTNLIVATLCWLMAAVHTTSACSGRIFSIWRGIGTFGTSHQDVVNMGSTRPYLENCIVTSLTVLETGVDSLCRTIEFRFSGTTSSGFAFGGVATPEKIDY